MEAILLGNPIKAKELTLPLIQTQAEEAEEMEEAEEGEILETPEEGEIP